MLSVPSVTVRAILCCHGLSISPRDALVGYCFRGRQANFTHGHPFRLFSSFADITIIILSIHNHKNSPAASFWSDRLELPEWSAEACQSRYWSRSCYLVVR
uniref:Uncharacterized protein n=1 Tax=Schistocephalus solidus TaxID=70667 RepID=A0A0X3P2C4_SCHSO